MYKRSNHRQSIKETALVTNPTFAAAKEAFFQSMKNTQKSKETIRGYQVDLNQFQKMLSNNSNAPVFVDAITEEKIEQYRQSFVQRQLKPASINRKINSISSFCNFAVKKKWLAYNPAQDVDRVKGKSAERSFLKAEEIQKIIGAITQPVAKYVVILMSNTGLRISEATNLQLKDVDLNKKMVYVKEGKGGKNRTVPMNAALVTQMKQYLTTVRPKTNSLNFFATKKTGGISQQYVNKILKEACKKIGMDKDVTSHVLRHSFASNLVKNKVHVAVIAKALGHADVRTTSVYMHADQSDLEHAVNQVDFLKEGVD